MPLFDGTNDSNVSYLQSKRFADKLRSVGGRVELVTFKDLDHQADDALARTELRRRSDEFLRSTFQPSAAGHRPRRGTPRVSLHAGLRYALRCHGSVELMLALRVHLAL